MRKSGWAHELSVAFYRDAISTRVVLLKQPRYLRGTFDTSEKPALLQEMKQQQAEIQEAEEEMKSIEATHKEMKAEEVMPPLGLDQACAC